MSFQTQVMDLLADKSMSTNDIHRNVGMSLNYVRTQLRMMEASNLISRVDDRTPVIYKISDNNPIIKNREAINKRKQQLMKPLDTNKDGEFIQLIKREAKSDWLKYAEQLDIVSAAIKELHTEDKLYETL